MRRRSNPTSRVATYLYCLVRSPRPPRAAALPPGLPGMSRPRVFDAGGSLWLVVAAAPLSRYGAAPVERGLRDLRWVSTRALAHEAVVERCARAGTVIPMKLSCPPGSARRWPTRTRSPRLLSRGSASSARRSRSLRGGSR